MTPSLAPVGEFFEYEVRWSAHGVPQVMFSDGWSAADAIVFAHQVMLNGGRQVRVWRCSRRGRWVLHARVGWLRCALRHRRSSKGRPAHA